MCYLPPELCVIYPLSRVIFTPWAVCYFPSPDHPGNPNPWDPESQGWSEEAHQPWRIGESPLVTPVLCFTLVGNLSGWCVILEIFFPDFV